MKTKILLVGESWVSAAAHFKGFDQFGSVTFHRGADPLVAALKDTPYELTYMTAHEAADGFPDSLDALSDYKAIILSDIGANTLLLPPSVWLNSRPTPNRLKVIEAFTAAGGGLAMIGGYLSFQGIDGRARWHRTPVERALPVNCLPLDDRLEIPEGFEPEIIAAEHPLFAGIVGPWPALLGANEVLVKSGADVSVLARLPEDQGGHPLLVTGQYGRGRTLVWTSDIGPHWVPNEFVAWPGYARFWANVAAWLTER